MVLSGHHEERQVARRSVGPGPLAGARVLSGGAGARVEDRLPIGRRWAGGRNAPNTEDDSLDG